MAAMRGRPSARVGRRTAADATARVAHRVSAYSSQQRGAIRTPMHARGATSTAIAVGRARIPFLGSGVVSERRAASRDGSDAGANRGALRPFVDSTPTPPEATPGASPAPRSLATAMTSPTQSLVVMAQYSKHDTRYLDGIRVVLQQAAGAVPAVALVGSSRPAPTARGPASTSSSSAGEVLRRTFASSAEPGPCNQTGSASPSRDPREC